MELNNYFEYCDAVELANKWGDEYSKGTPSVSDAEYDLLYKKILAFEKLNPTMVVKESPTRKVHSDSSDGFIKVNHKHPMLSIQNSNGYVELESWLKDRCNKGVDEYVVEFKIDGLALSLIYENGDLVDAVTRGNGSTGDSVIANARAIKSIPKKLEGFTGEIRGEVVWLLDSFFKYQSMLEAEGKDAFANPRNGASGTLKLKDPTEVANRNLDFIAYSVVEGSLRPKHSDDLLVMKSHGFLVSDHYIGNDANSVLDIAKSMEEMRSKLSFLTDGLVIKTNKKSIYKDLGGTSKTPHYLTALKFPPEEKEVEVVDIEHSYGRTGAVTPVCIVKPVQLSGTVVERASLHNWDILEFLGLYKGCKVVVRKAGEIIPEVVSVVGSNKTKTDYELFTNKNTRASLGMEIAKNRSLNKDKDFYLRPTTCLHCNSKLMNPVNKNGDVLVSLECPNKDCPVKQFKNIVRFVSKDAMDIVGIDESIVEKMLSAGIIKDITDIYKLTMNDALKIDGFRDRSAQKMIAAIESSKKNPMNKLLVGFSIPNCGRTLADKLSQEIETLDNFKKLTKDKLTSMPDVGEETANSIVNWIQANDSTINFFLESGIGVKAKDGIKKVSDKLSGKVLIMTGSSEKVERNQFKELVVANGGKVVSGISAKVNYVLVGDSPGPDKMKKVADLKAKGIQINTITDDEFLSMIS